MDQAKAVINLKEGIIQLEGPVDFVQRHLERYAPAVKGLPAIESTTAPSAAPKKPRAKARTGRRSCTRAIRAEIKAGFFDESKAARAVMGRLTERGIECSVGALRAGLKKAVQEERLVTAGRGRGLTYRRNAQGGEDASTPESGSET